MENFNVYCVSNQCDTHKCSEIAAENIDEAYEILRNTYSHDSEDYAGYSVSIHKGDDFWRYELL